MVRCSLWLLSAAAALCRATAADPAVILEPLSPARDKPLLVSMESVDLSNSSEFSDRDRLGHHLIIDLYGCNPEKLKEIPEVERIMVAAAEAAKATIVARKFHQFNPIGVSGALVLAESHLTIHTWPEVDAYCAIDMFTCGDTDNFAALEVLKREFEAQGSVVVEIERGKQRQRTETHDNSTVFQEALDPLNGFRTTVTTKNLLEDATSAFQNIKMYDTEPVGKMMVIDGVIQYTEYDNAAYHEMIVHVPMQAHPTAKRVLIIGGGDGGALAELIKYASVEEIVICDIDELVSRIAGKYTPEFGTAYADPRVRPLFQDGAALVATFQDYFDVIIIDCTDFYGPAAPFARKEFYQNIHRALKSDGVMVIQAESMYFHRDFIVSLHKQVRELFPIAKYYHTLVPTYPSGTIGFLFGSKLHGPMDFLGKNTQSLPDLDYYSPEIHAASFAVPQFLKRMLEVSE
jgi:spermidine synthase